MVDQARKLRERATEIENRLLSRKQDRELREIRAQLEQTDAGDEVINESAPTEKEHAE